MRASAGAMSPLTQWPAEGTGRSPSLSCRGGKEPEWLGGKCTVHSAWSVLLRPSTISTLIYLLPNFCFLLEFYCPRFQHFSRLHGAVADVKGYQSKLN
jgi:hypothetical protein